MKEVYLLAISEVHVGTSRPSTWLEIEKSLIRYMLKDKWHVLLPILVTV